MSQPRSLIFCSVCCPAMSATFLSGSSHTAKLDTEVSRRALRHPTPLNYAATPALRPCHRPFQRIQYSSCGENAGLLSKLVTPEHHIDCRTGTGSATRSFHFSPTLVAKSKNNIHGTTSAAGASTSGVYPVRKAPRIPETDPMRRDPLWRRHHPPPRFYRSRFLGSIYAVLVCLRYGKASVGSRNPPLVLNSAFLRQKWRAFCPFCQ